MKKITQLSRDELRVSIKHAMNEPLSEEEMDIYTHISSCKTAKHSTAHVLPPTIDSPSLMPYKTDYLFHTTNLLGTASLLTFVPQVIIEITAAKAVLKGDITFNYEPRKGRIIIALQTHNVYFQGGCHKYLLQIDPSKKVAWEQLIDVLKKE